MPPANLSTPHGTLGTDGVEIEKLKRLFLSTPHGTLGTVSCVGGWLWENRLSTPHGTLGTGVKLGWERAFQIAFNSTRYIRNICGGTCSDA